MKMMERIQIDKKNYDIGLTINGSHLPKNLSISDEPRWICAYVILKRTNKDYTEFANCTYREDNVYGVDTAHSYNDKMTLEEKRQDAIKQIRKVIKAVNES